MVVATRSVPVGAVLSTGDVSVRQLPATAVPATALADPALAVGHPVAGVLSEGEVLTVHDVGTGSLLAGQPTGHLAVWLPLTEPAVVEALTAGDRVDVLSPVDGRQVVQDVTVLAVRRGVSGAASSPGLMGGAGGAGREGLGAWLALAAEQSRALAAARGADPAGGALLLALHPAPSGR